MTGKTLHNARYPALHFTALRNASKAPSTPFADGGPHCTMNDLPIPEGDWQEDYTRKNMKNTAILMLGIGSFITSLYMHFTDENIHWNYKVPEYDKCS
ncbi:uncharacterized protein LOC118745208 [Rhagoletis pomonella]|uniref:uncharacterized protein LOC118745208 n=1 Tax=Rhagoletis pomonella TaxID=28610 RepID=UPI001780E972|nr:uncharacterized protein LOC118745208 [Rhagoletis pomonella]